jgi:hypothetical protein
MGRGDIDVTPKAIYNGGDTTMEKEEALQKEGKMESTTIYLRLQPGPSDQLSMDVLQDGDIVETRLVDKDKVREAVFALHGEHPNSVVVDSNFRGRRLPLKTQTGIVPDIMHHDAAEIAELSGMFADTELQIVKAAAKCPTCRVSYAFDQEQGESTVFVWDWEVILCESHA